MKVLTTDIFVSRSIIKHKMISKSNRFKSGHFVEITLDELIGYK